MTDWTSQLGLPDLEQQYNLPSGLLTSVMNAESSGNPNAVSPTGAQGLFQFEPSTAKAYNIDPTDPQQAAQGAAKMLSDLTQQYKGDVPTALAAYNWGSGNIAKHGIENAPSETQKYVAKVMGALPDQSMQVASNDTQTTYTPLSNNTTMDASKLSDADLDAQIAKLQGSQPQSDISKLSDTDLDAQIAKLQGSQSPSLIDSALQPIGNIPAMASADANAGLKAMTQPFPEPTGSIGQDLLAGQKDVFTRAAGLGTYLGSPFSGAARALAGKPIASVAQANGVSPAIAKNWIENPIAAAGTIGLPMAAGKYLPDVMALGSDALDGIKNSSFLQDESSANGPFLTGAQKVKEALTTEPVDYDPYATHSSISATYGAAKDQAGKYYDFMRGLAEDKSAPASGIKDSLDGIIADIHADPLNEGRSQLPYLKKLSDSIGDGDTMPLSDAVQLKQNLNANFNPKRFSQGADTPYQMLGSSVDASLSKAAKMYPDFGEAKTLADKNWLNTVKSPFENNTVLQQYWKPEDYYAQKSVDNGMLEELPDQTTQRAETMLNKIKTPTQLKAVQRVLPDEHADTLAQAKVQQITQGQGAGRAQAAGKVAYNLVTGHLPSALRSAADVINPGYTDAEQALLDAAKEDAPRLSTKYAQPFSDLQAKVQSKAAAQANAPKLLTYQPQTPPTTDILAGRGVSTGKTAVLSPEEQAALDAQRWEQENLGFDPGIRGAQFKNAQSSYSEQNPESDFFDEQSESPLSQAEQSWKNMQDSKPEKFAKGGKAKKKKSAQSVKLPQLNSYVASLMRGD